MKAAEFGFLQALSQDIFLHSDEISDSYLKNITNTKKKNLTYSEQPPYKYYSLSKKGEKSSKKEKANQDSVFQEIQTLDLKTNPPITVYMSLIADGHSSKGEKASAEAKLHLLPAIQDVFRKLTLDDIKDKQKVIDQLLSATQKIITQTNDTIREYRAGTTFNLVLAIPEGNDEHTCYVINCGDTSAFKLTDNKENDKKKCEYIYIPLNSLHSVKVLPWITKEISPVLFEQFHTHVKPHQSEKNGACYGLYETSKDDHEKIKSLTKQRLSTLIPDQKKLLSEICNHIFTPLNFEVSGAILFKQKSISVQEHEIYKSAQVKDKTTLLNQLKDRAFQIKSQSNEEITTANLSTPSQQDEHPHDTSELGLEDLAGLQDSDRVEVFQAYTLKEAGKEGVHKEAGTSYTRSIDSAYSKHPLVTAEVDISYATLKPGDIVYQFSDFMTQSKFALLVEYLKLEDLTDPEICDILVNTLNLDDASISCMTIEKATPQTCRVQ